MIRIGEPVFRSIQGEGIRTGVLSLWVRFFGCNLNCHGFMQPNPADKSTWKLPQFDNAAQYKSLAELPVFETGCDSGYSWSKEYKHLALSYKDGGEFYRKEILPYMYRSLDDASASWNNPFTKNDVDLCFTGGEPMLWQKQLVEICQALPLLPKCIQIETNGTKEIAPEFLEWYKHNSFLLCWNISPKLLNVAGEDSKRAWKPDIIKSYFDLSAYGHLKFVMNNDPKSWVELNNKVAQLRDIGVDAPIYIMPTGSSHAQQTDVSHLKNIAESAIDKGYHVSGRLHSVLFGNGIGT